MAEDSIAVWRHLIGDMIDDLVSDESMALGLLLHHSPLVRQACVHCLTFFHPQSETNAHLLWDRLLAEPNPEVLHTMITYLSSYYRASKRPDILSSLAQIALDKTFSAFVRRAAYSGVLSVIGECDAYYSSILRPNGRLNYRLLRSLV